MADLSRRIEEAAAHMQSDWSPARLQVVERKMMARKQRRARVKVGAFVVASSAVLAVLLIIGFGRFRGVPDVPETTALVPSLDVLRFADGSVAKPIRPGTVMRSEAVNPTKVEVSIASGAARFEVSPDPARVFLVRAGDVTIQVVGTAFTVAKEEGDRVRVEVERGEVLVRWTNGERGLKRGEFGRFPPSSGELPVDMEVQLDEPAGSVSAPIVAPPPPRMEVPDWRALGKQMQHAEAYEALRREGMDSIRDDPSDLMLAADVARLSGHSAQAVGPLQRVVSNHPGDPRAPLAAFTLGRVLLDELGRPGQAAGAFASARRLAPGGALAQDALAREVESLSKAGQAVAARERALEYVKHYPNGIRINSVKRWGGLE